MGKIIQTSKTYKVRKKHISGIRFHIIKKKKKIPPCKQGFSNNKSVNASHWQIPFPQ